MRVLTILIAFALTAFAQRHSLTEVDAEKPDGKVLQRILQAADAAERTKLLEQFVEQFPKADGAPWAMEQLLAIYAKGSEADKVIAIGEKLLAVDPDETEAGLQCLKAYEAKHDFEQIKKYSGLTSTLARKMAATPQPEDSELVGNWKLEQAYAKQVDAYCEYALYRVVAESRDPKVTIEFAELLPQRYPQGQYAGKLDNTLFVAYRQAGMNDKSLALAERVLATDQSNEDMLLVAADSYMQNKKEPEKVHAYCARLVELMGSKPKPEGVTDDAWAARKNTVMGVAHYLDGKLHWNENHFPQADQQLRAALPFVENTPASKGEVLYLLGYAAYKMEKPQEAANFYRACAAVKSDYQARATKNLQLLKTQFTGIK